MGTTRSKADFPDQAHRRRKLIAKSAKIELDDGIRCISEYVEGPRGNVLFTKCFIPEASAIIDDDVDRPKGLICQCMGYTDHCDYSRMVIAQEFCRRGYAYFVWDHYGHGRSAGLWIDISNMQWLCDDTVFICNYAQRKYPFANNYLFGRSMGGNIVTRILIQIQQDEHHRHRDFVSKQRWNGVVLFSPMVAVDPSHLFHPLLMYVFENWAAHYMPTAALVPKSIGADWTTLSRDKEMALFLRDDPLSFPFGPRFKTGLELIKSCQFVKEHSEVIAENEIPLLVLHGTGDTVTESASSQLMVDRIARKQETMERRISRKHLLIEGGVHSLLLDSAREDVLAQSVRWIDRHNR